MDGLVTIHHQKLAEKFKKKIACTLQWFLTSFCLGRKLSQDKMTFFYLIYKRYIMAKLILPRSKNVEQHIFRIETRMFSKNFKEPVNYGNELKF